MTATIVRGVGTPGATRAGRGMGRGEGGEAFFFDNE